MWLLNTITYRLHFFADIDKPKYSIISHRWGEQEISFENLRDCQMIENQLLSFSIEEEEAFPHLCELRKYRVNRLTSTKGWSKIQKLCEKSRSCDLGWTWIDTACIDKSSSAELQEAINSMFRWYQNAHKCFVYLHDVTADHTDDVKLCKSQLRASSWFTRAWTLQELLAPPSKTIEFLNRDWVDIGKYADLINDISSITTVPLKILSVESVATKHALLLDCSVAQRMSWAANRKATRAEDVAYSLLGIFDCNIPMLYGEGGRKAFERLQLEILKTSNDETILAWNAIDNRKSLDVLATSPLDFAYSGNLEVIHRGYKYANSRGMPAQMSQKGLLMDVTIIDLQSSSKYVPSTVTTSNVVSRFVLPLLSIERRLGRVEPTVFVRLQHWKHSEYVRMPGFFTAELDWEELDKNNRSQQIILRSDKSFRRMTAKSS